MSVCVCVTVAVLQLDQQRVLVHEVVKIGDDVVVMQNGQNADLVHHISALLVRQIVQLDLLPHHQRVILHTSPQNQLDQLNLCMCLRCLIH